MNDAEPTPLQLADGSEVGALWLAPPDAWAAYVFAHGAGAGMQHAFMAGLAHSLAAHGVATLRFNFPWIERGSRRVDAPPVAHATIAAALAETRRRAPGLPCHAGGKSFGGRMTSQAQALGLLPGLAGLVFVGFPLHPAGQPGVARAEHLAGVTVPMLFVQGTRDELADAALLKQALAPLGERATLHWIDGADHAFAVRGAGRTRRGAAADAPPMAERLAGVIAGWMRERRG
jgi:predicted alpha/beta-hydrolase family hydrolase